MPISNWGISEGLGLTTMCFWSTKSRTSIGMTLGIIARSGCQIVYVGDRNQQLYEWRGAVDAMDSVKVDRTAGAHSKLASRACRCRGRESNSRAFGK